MAEIDISTKLGKDKQMLKIAEGKEYEVDTSADTYLSVQEELSKENFSTASIYNMIEKLMGEKALKDIKDMKLTVKGLETIAIALSALVSEEPYEDMEKRFQKQ